MEYFVSQCWIHMNITVKQRKTKVEGYNLWIRSHSFMQFFLSHHYICPWITDTLTKGSTSTSCGTKRAVLIISLFWDRAPTDSTGNARTAWIISPRTWKYTVCPLPFWVLFGFVMLWLYHQDHKLLIYPYSLGLIQWHSVITHCQWSICDCSHLQFEQEICLHIYHIYCTKQEENFCCSYQMKVLF